MPKKFSFISRTNWPQCESVEKCSVFIIFRCSHDGVLIMCRLEFRFQNLPFSKSAGKNVSFFCLNERPICHVFRRSQNVPVGVPFSKSTVFKICQQKCAVSCEREAYSSHFSPFSKMCRHRVNAVWLKFFSAIPNEPNWAFWLDWLPRFSDEYRVLFFSKVDVNRWCKYIGHRMTKDLYQYDC